MQSSQFTGERHKVEPRPQTLAGMLDVARNLIRRQSQDVEKMLMLLANLPTDEVDVQARGAIAHARTLMALALNGTTSHVAIARFALARVIVLLEKHVADEASRAKS